jgi:hypothetical protein
MMCAGTHPNRNLEGQMDRHEPRELLPGLLLAEDGGPVRHSGLNLEHVLGQIDADGANFFH